MGFRSAVGLLMVVSACSATDRDATPAPLPALVVQPSVAEPKAPAPTPPSPVPIPEADVRTLFDTWLASQNSGDVAAYDNLYARTFLGVKRSGERVRRFARESWLKDRARMFRAPMTVRVADVRIVTTPGFATLNFTQHWSSGTYSDVGPKSMIVVKEDGALRIGNESMLRSDVAGVVTAAVPAIAEFALVTSVGDRHYVVLSASADPTIVTDVEPVLVGGEFHAAALKPVRRALLAPNIASVIGEPVDVYGAGGRVCTALTKSPSLMRVIRGDGVSFSEGYFGVERVDQARSVWNHSDEHTLLVAELRATGGTCAHPIWTRSSALSKPVVFSAEPPLDAQQRQVGLDVLRKLPAYAAGRRELREEGFDRAALAHWDEEDATVVERWSGGDRTFQTVNAEVGGCGDPYAGVWALMEISPVAHVDPVVLNDRNASSALRTLAVLDFDGDGAIEVVGYSWQSDSTFLLRVVNGHLVPAIWVTHTFLGCRC